MYSLNVPVPGDVERLAARLHPRLSGFERVRERHSLVCKRFESEEYHRLYSRLTRSLAGAPAFEARVTDIASFDDPVRGPGPVVYLAVESRGLVSLHDRLVGTFGAIPRLEGAAYVPHVTLARGGERTRAGELCAREVDPIDWEVSELVVYDGVHDERVSTVSLPVSY